MLSALLLEGLWDIAAPEDCLQFSVRDFRRTASFRHACEPHIFGNGLGALWNNTALGRHIAFGVRRMTSRANELLRQALMLPPYERASVLSGFPRVVMRLELGLGLAGGCARASRWETAQRSFIDDN